MKRYVRFFSFVLCLCIAFALVACGGTGKSTGTQAPSGNDSETDAPESGESNVLFDASSYPLTEDDVVFTIFNRFQTTQLSNLPSGNWDTNPAYMDSVEILGIEIEFQTIATDNYPEMFQISVAGGDYPDMYGVVPIVYTAGIDNAIESEIIIDLAPYLEDYAPDYYALMESDEDFRKGATTDGGYVAAFYQKKMVEDYSSNRGPFIRQDWLNELGMEAPETYDELHDVLTAFKTEMGAEQPLFLTMYGVLCGSSVASGYNIACGTNGVDPYLYQIDGTVYCGFLSDGFLEYLQMMNQWYNEGLILSDFTATAESFGWGNEIREAVANGETGYYVAEYRMGENDWADENIDPDCVLSPIPEPVKNPGDINHINANAGTIDYPGLSITTACENVELAVAWNNFWFSEQGVILANYGYEGITFEYVDGKPVLTDFVLNNPDGYTSEQVLYSYCFFGAATHLDNKRYLAQGVADDREVWGSNKDGAYDLPKDSVLTMTVEEGDLYNDAYGDVLTFVQESVPRFITGEKSFDEFEEFQQTLLDLGVQNMIDTTQAALDRYNQR